MTRAILDGRKLETRRVVKPGATRCPWGETGGLLWVRESWALMDGRFLFHATIGPEDEKARCLRGIRWRPAWYMPRRACRLWLRLESVRTEHLWEIGVDGTIAEGLVSRPDPPTREQRLHPERYAASRLGLARRQFAVLWDSLHMRPESVWSANPEVWVLRFRRLTHPADCLAYP